MQSHTKIESTEHGYLVTCNHADFPQREFRTAFYAAHYARKAESRIEKEIEKGIYFPVWTDLYCVSFAFRDEALSYSDASIFIEQCKAELQSRGYSHFIKPGLYHYGDCLHVKIYFAEFAPSESAEFINDFTKDFFEEIPHRKDVIRR